MHRLRTICCHTDWTGTGCIMSQLRQGGPVCLHFSLCDPVQTGGFGPQISRRCELGTHKARAAKRRSPACGCPATAAAPTPAQGCQGGRDARQWDTGAVAAPGFETMSEASVTCPASAGLVGESLIVHLEQQLKRTQLDGVRGRIIVRDVCHVDLRAAATVA